MNVPLHPGDEFGILLRQKKCNDLCPRDKPNEKIDVYDCPDILAILSWNMGRPAQLQPEKRSQQGRHLLFLHTKRLEIRGSRQIFCPTLAFARFFSGSRAQLWERSMKLRLYSLVQWNWFSDVTDACNSGVSSDHGEPISLHEALSLCWKVCTHPSIFLETFGLVIFLVFLKNVPFSPQR